MGLELFTGAPCQNLLQILWQALKSNNFYLLRVDLILGVSPRLLRTQLTEQTGGHHVGGDCFPWLAPILLLRGAVKARSPPGAMAAWAGVLAPSDVTQPEKMAVP